jgi:predicted membrane protein
MMKRLRQMFLFIFASFLLFLIALGLAYVSGQSEGVITVVLFCISAIAALANKVHKDIMQRREKRISEIETVKISDKGI